MTITAEELRHLVLNELESLNIIYDDRGDLISPPFTKESAKLLHKPSREIELRKAQSWIKIKIEKFRNYFANGKDIHPQLIKPALVLVTENWHKDLFRLARYYWSIPYSYGFGRRLRYLIFDESNEKLIGIFGLQSPPISFSVRDNLFNYPDGKKSELINQTMDVYTLGALPPYNRLLGGKLIGLAVASNEVREDYKNIYTEKRTIIEKRVLPAELVALTTTSAFGRSSIYNRLKYKNITVAESIGYTNGYGNFHLQKIYPYFKEFLSGENVSVLGGYGTGPKRSWQIISQAKNRIGISNNILKHGIKREVFLFRLIENLEEYLNGITNKPKYRDLPFDCLADFWKERWLKARLSRVNGWHKWNNEEIEKSIIFGT